MKEDGDDEHCALIADLTVWQPQYEGIFDIRVVDTDACQIAPMFHRILYKHQRWTRSISTPRPARIKESRFYPNLCGLLRKERHLFLHHLCEFVCKMGMTLWINDGLDHLPSYGPLYYVCVDRSPSESAWELSVVPLCLFFSITHRLAVDFCVYVCTSMLVFSFSLFCYCM